MDRHEVAIGVLVGAVEKSSHSEDEGNYTHKEAEATDLVSNGLKLALKRGHFVLNVELLLSLARTGVLAHSADKSGT